MTRQVARLLMVFAVTASIFAVLGVANSSDSTTESLLLIGNIVFPGSDGSETEIPTSSSIPLTDKSIYPQETTATIMVQGEKWFFYYCLDWQQGKYASRLKIVDSKKAILWEDDWESTSDDILDLLTSAEHATTRQWVEGYFGRKFSYGPSWEIRKIDENEFSTNLLECSTDVVGMDRDDLAKQLANGNKYIVFCYRKTQRQDLMEVAFLPEIRKFAAFSDTPTSPSILLTDKKIYPLETTATINVQGEEWRFNYRLDYQEDKFLSNLKIADSQNLVLWEDEWSSEPGDLYTMLMTADGVNTRQWVEGYFGRKLFCGPRLEIRKIRKEELFPEYIEWSTHDADMQRDALCKKLTDGSKYIVLWYRKTWLEDVMEIVFLPEKRKFVTFSNGPY